jgi:cell division protein FtsW
MPKPVKPDYSLFLVTLALAVAGVVMVFSASAVWAGQRFDDPTHFSFKQVVAAALGVAVMFLIMKVDYHHYKKPMVVYSIISMVVALCVLALVQPEVRGTHRWIQLPGFSFQPSELAKLGLVAFLAYFIDRRKGQINDARYTLLPIGVMAGVLSAVILLQKDLGTVLALMLITFILLYIAGLRLRWIGIASLLALPVGYIAFYLLVYLVPYRWNRILVFWDPWIDASGYGWQTIQGLTAVASGGIAGLGYMASRQKMFFLPDAHTDFIFAIIGEELGLLGTLFVLTMFAVFLWRGLATAMRAPDLFGFYLALGLTLTICLQAFINMSVVLKLVPSKGIPLPFLSYGGSSFVVMLAAVGVLLNISQQQDAREPGAS